MSIRSARASTGDKLGSGSHHRKKLAVEMKTLWVNRESGVQYQPSTLSDALPGRVSAKSAHTRGRAHVWGTNFITVIASNAKCLQSRLQIFGWRTLQSLVALHLRQPTWPRWIAHKHLDPLEFFVQKARVVRAAVNSRNLNFKTLYLIFWYLPKSLLGAT